MRYAELNCISNFTFLKGASHADELVARAAELGLSAIAIADTNSFAGIVRGHAAAKELGLTYLVAVRLILQDGAELVAYPKTRKGYGNLCRLLTLGKRRASKGQCHLAIEDVLEWGGECVFILIEGTEHLPVLKNAFGEDIFLALKPAYDGEDAARFKARHRMSEALGVPLVCVGHVLMHSAKRRRLADVLSCMREKVKIDQLGRLAQPNAEARLKSEFEMRRLFKTYPEAMANTELVVARCPFSLDELKYEYPDEVTNGENADARLRRLTEAGLTWRYPDGLTPRVQAMVAKELKLIKELNYARYFLTVYDIVAFARAQNILCQGRGSAANSVVCYALGITEASPETISMVFERFSLRCAENRPILMSILSMNAAKKSSSIFIKNMAVTARAFAQPLFIFGAGPLFAKSARRWGYPKMLWRPYPLKFGAQRAGVLARSASRLRVWMQPTRVCARP